MKTYNYVYKITNLKPKDQRKYYIGVRTSKYKPEKDIKYMSSSKYLKEAIAEQGIENFKKEILSVWESRELANLEEIRLHTEFNVSTNPNFYNKAESRGDGFCTRGQVTVIDIRDGSTKNVSREEYQLFEYYISTMNGLVTAIDVRDGSIKKVTCEEFAKHNFYQHPTTGQVTVFDKNQGIYKNIPKEEYSPHDTTYSPSASGMVLVKDLRDGKIKTVTRADYKEFDHYEFITKGKLCVVDTNLGITRHATIEEFKNNENLVAQAKGKVNVIDIRDGQRKQITKEEFDAHEYYCSVNINTITVIDTRDGSTKKISKEDYKKFDYYVNIRSKRIKVFNAEDQLIVETFGNFNIKMRELGLPSNALKNSYRNDGKRIYLNKSNAGPDASEDKFDKFKGWYAKES